MTNDAARAKEAVSNALREERARILKIVQKAADDCATYAWIAEAIRHGEGGVHE